MTNATEIRLVGMSRSGNHALIAWIWAQAEGRRCLLNCAEPRTNPFLSCRPLDDGRPWRSTDTGFDMAAEQAGRHRDKDLLLHSYEDTCLGPVFDAAFETRHDAWVGPSRRRIDVLLLRDPFNLFASRLSAGFETPVGTLRRVWKQHARAYLGDRPHLRHRPLVVSYNRWTADRTYRAAIARHLGLAFTDAGRESVPGCHGGSSFDGRQYHGRAAEMPVHDRWRKWIGSPRYQALFDDGILDLAARAFGPLPATAALAGGAVEPTAERERSLASAC